MTAAYPSVVAFLTERFVLTKSAGFRVADSRRGGGLKSATRMDAKDRSWAERPFMRQVARRGLPPIVSLNIKSVASAPSISS
jgi:hypothetical protein